MAEFECKPGYCVKCCTDIVILPVTLGDLYRTWFYRKKTGEETSFHNIFRELCNDWVAVPSSDSYDIRAMPNSKVPCRNLNRKEKKCSVHGFARYVGCALFPEDWLLPAPSYYLDDKKSLDFVNSLECFQGTTLTEERKSRILQLRDLMDREIGVTVKTLESMIFPNSIIKGKPSKRIQRELFEKIRYISNYKENIRIVRENLIKNNILQDYEKLVMTENLGFSYCEEI